MNEPDYAQVTTEPLRRSRKENLLLRKLPFIIVFALTIFGVAYASISQQPIAGYWEFLAVAVGIICVTTGWPDCEDNHARFRLIWQQVAHWAAIVFSMNIVLLPRVQMMLTGPATGLTLLMLLALGAFLAGIHISWQICVLGFGMALAVPAIVWLKQSVLFIALGAAAVIALGITFWRR
jgi:hypothetical protein